jgi:hypothetical protein
LIFDFFSRAKIFGHPHHSNKDDQANAFIELNIHTIPLACAHCTLIQRVDRHTTIDQSLYSSKPALFRDSQDGGRGKLSSCQSL